MNYFVTSSQVADRRCSGTASDFFTKTLISFLLLVLASSAYAVPQTLDWDNETWTPEGPTNLSETITIGGHPIPVTVGGNTAFLDNTPSPIAPAINSQNTGGLSPVETSLYIGTDYGTNTPTQVSITLDFSDFPGGVGNISFTLFDIDSNGNSYVDEAEVTAVNGTGVINPTALTPSSANMVLDANSIVGTATSNSGLANANATFAFAQTGITSLTVVYKNNAPNVGFQWMNFHDISFDAPATDIAVQKSANTLTPNVGDPVVFTITATNNGPDATSTVNILDQLPAGITYVSDNSGGNYNSVSGIWNAGAFTNGQIKTLQITGTVNPTGPYANTASLDFVAGDDTNAANNSQTVTLTPVQVADLSVTKGVSNSQPAVGSVVTFTVNVANAGPNTATNVAVTDLLPAGYGSVSGTATVGTYVPGTGIWTVGSLASTANATLTITATVLASGPYNNIAQVSASDQFDPDSTPNNNVEAEDDQQTVAVTPPEMGVAKQISSGPTSNGNGTHTLTYSILVTNTGDTALNNMQVTDSLATTFAGATSFVVDSVTSATFSVNGGYNGAANTNLLNATDTLAIGASGTINVTVTVTPGANFGPYNNAATGSGTSPGGTGVSDISQSGANVDPDGDGNPGNNSAPTPVTFAEAPEIGVAKDITAGPTNNGNGTYAMTYTVLVENTGDVALNNVQVVDSLATTFGGATFAVNSVTSAGLAVNPGFNGAANTNLLAGTDTLAIGASGSIDVAITVTPGGNLGPYNNTAMGNGTSPLGTGVSDDSQSGANVDPDGDGNPGNNSVPTPVSFAEAPEIGVAKTISAGPVNNGNGTYNLTYTLAVTNTGDVPLNAVQVTDSLATTFGGATFAVNSVTATGLAANAGYNGGANTNLLAGTDTLAVGASGSIDVAITVTPGGNLGPYNNTATGNGTSPGGTGVSDVSQDGTNVDPDGDGNPGNNSVTTPVSFAEAPEIGVAKTISAGPVNNGNGTYNLTYTLAVTNTGDVPLNAVQVTDSLATTFGGATFAVNSVTATGLAANAGYNGGANTNLLAGTDTLAVGASGSIDVAITVTPGGNLGPYNNTATGNGTSPGGTGVSDVSQDGTNVDPDGDGNPGNNSVTTPVSFAEAPEIGVAKTISAGPVNNGNGTYNLTYTLAVTNTGDVPLNAVQVTDSLATTFGGATFAVNSVTATGLAANAGYNGGADTNLLAGTDTLAVGASGSIDVAITVTPGGNLGPYNNTATGNGTSPGGTGVSDVSQDGTNVDPDGDGNPGNNSVTTPVSFAEAPEIGVAKTISAGPVNNGNGTYNLTYTLAVTNTGDVPLNAVQVTDSLATTFGGATFAVNSVTATGLAANAGYNGGANTNLLAGTDTLAVGASGSIDVAITVTPGGNLGPYNNTATGNGTSPGGTGVSDVSQDGTNVDPDGDGNPGNNSVTTPVSFAEAPEIGVAKTISAGPVNNGNGTYNLTYTLAVTNTGDVPLNAVQVTDSLATTFGGATFAVNSVTATGLAANAGYNGGADTNLLAGTDTLAVGASGSIDVAITVTPGGNLGPYNNTATGNGTSPGGTGVSDVSQDGTNVDPDGDGNPGNNSVTTPVSFVEAPEIGTAKLVSVGPTSNGDGTYDLTYTILVENTGDVALNGVQVTDSLVTTFSGASFAINSVTSADFAVNSGFNGAGVTNLLTGADTLAVSGTGTINVSLTVTPGGNLGPYNNSATASGTSPGGMGVNDVSQTGNNVDPDNDGNPGNNNVPTPVSFVEAPQIGTAKAISNGPTNNGNGSYTLTYTIAVENTGDVLLNSVQLVDNLGATYTGATFIVDSVSSGTLAANAGFNGLGNSNLLLGTDSLTPGASGTVDVTVTVTPGANLGPYNNSVTASGDSPGGTGVTDLSQNGSNVDPDNDGNPGNNSVPTPVNFSEAPQIGTAKTITTGPTSNGDGSFTLAYDIRVLNTGDVPLSGVQVADSLSATYATATSFTVDSISSATFAVDVGFDGGANDTLLAGTDTLALGTSGIVSVTVTVTPGANLGPYNNTATASGNSPSGAPVSDDSQTGTNPDPDNDGNPGNNNAPTPVTFSESPEIGLAKSISAAPVNNGDGTYTVTYTLLVDNTGDVPLDSLQVTDSMATTFAAATSFVVDGVSSATFATNATYNGDANINLLQGADVLAPGATGTINVTVTVEPGAFFGPYDNTATVGGTSPGGNAVSDVSQEGANVDPDNDGNPGNNSNLTPVSFNEAPAIGVAKQLTSGPVSNGDGSFTLGYTIVVENAGDNVLSSVQVTEDFDTTFAVASSYTVDAISSATLAVNTGFNGSANTNMLTGADSLPVAGSGSILVTVTVVPGSNLGPYDNIATGSGLSPAGTSVSDVSTDGADIDPNGNGNPSDDSTPTPVTFVEMPQIGTAKTVSTAPANNGDGTYTLTYTISLANTGDVDLSAIQITDDLAVTYASASSFSVLSTASADFALNAGYDGNGNNNLLTGSGVLAAGASGILTVTVVVEPGANFGPYNNTANGSGQSPSGTGVNDTSQDGTNVDPDNDGNPGNNSVPTPVSFAEAPQIGIAKAVTAGPTSNGDGTANLTYTFTVENTGDVALSGLQVVDDLATTFAVASNFTVASITSGGLTVNPLFNGAANANLLTGADTLAAGGSETITVTLTVEPGANLGPYDNLATANGTSPGGAGVMDTSTDGVDVDPDNNGNPGDNSAPTPVTFAEMPQIGLAKTVSSAPVSNGDSTSTLTYTLTVENSGDTALNNLQVTDDLSVTFGTTVFTVDSVTSGTLSANGAYDGSTDLNLLSGLDSLAIGASGTIDVTVTVTPAANLGPYNNVANAQGASPSGTNATDMSQDGTVPDANGNGDPGDDSAPTPVSFTEMPSIGLAKSVSAAPVNNGNGTFTLSYTLTVDNTGDVDLSALQVTDDLATAFAGATFVVDSVSSTDFTLDAGFDGSANQTLLTGVDTLVTSATGTIDIQLTVTPGANFGPYDNQAQASGDSPTGATVNDLSQSGANVDPDGDGNPGNNSDPTPVSFNESPQIGVAKALSTGPTSNGNGTFSLAYTVLVENTGDVDLSAVQLNENFDTTFAAAGTYTVDSVTSGDLSVNAGFNGSTATSLLDGTDTLVVGATGTVIITVTVTPGANLGPYNNTVTGTGNSPAGTPVSDDSQDGANVDPDGNGNPGDNAVPTPVSFSEMPEIGLAKAVTAGPVENGDGSSTLTYTLLVENSGDVDLLNVQVADDLATTFSGATLVFDSASSADFAVSASYNGSTDTNVLAGTDSLAAGASGTISITVTVTPGANLGPYNNLATTTGESPAGTMVSDTSTDGTSVDPDNDGDPGNNSVPTPVTFAEMPQLGLAEALGGTPVDNGDGTYTLTYVLFVENSGTVPMSNVQIVDDIATVFAGATAVVVDGISSGDLTVNPGYDGAGDTNLLAGTDTLAAGQNGTVVITVTVTPGANLGPYNNTATTTGDSPAGTMVSDISQDGVDPDPDNDGNPGNNSDPTPVMFAEVPEISVAKTISSGPTDSGGGTFALTYNIIVQNSGNTPLSNVQLTDSLALTYTGATSFTVTSVTSATLAVNPGYNGDADANLLAGTDTLALGATGSVLVAVTVEPGANLGPYNNSATGTGDSPAGTGVSDISQNGANPDPDGDGNPGNNSELTPVNFSEAPQIGTAKALINGPVDNGDGTSTVTYTITVENVGDTDLSALQVTDNLATTYMGADSFVVDSVSSTDFTVNPGFNGAGVNNLLNAVDTLVISASGTIDVTVTITPGANLGPYENTATAAGTSPAGTTVSDDSTDGTIVDPDGDDDPSNNNVPTPVTFVEAPELGLAETISSAPVDNGDGTYSLTYSLFIENSGSVPINTVQIVDDLGTVFTLASGVVVDGITSADLTINPGYDGVTDTNLLVGTETLGVGASGTVEIMVTVTPGAFLGPYDNTATATGQSPAGSTVTDVSQDGTNPDPDGDGDPGNNSDPTPVSFAETPQIGIAKAVTTAPVDNGNGTVSLAYTLLVNNSGSVALSTLQVVDSLATTFAGASAFAIDSVTSTDFATNAAYDGDADSNLLDGTDTLTVGASGTIVVAVTVTPAGNAGPYNNTATATGLSPASVTVTDVSQDGTNPDPDGDGNPGNNSDPTPITFAETPQIGIAKAVTAAPVDNGNGTISLAYTLLVNNSGNVTLNSVQAVDSLATTFAGAVVVVDSVTSADFTVNNAYDGDADSNLLTGSDALAIGASGSIVVAVTVTPAGNAGPFNNTATATGVSPASATVTDDSTDGTDPDPDGDGNPGNNSDPTPVSLAEMPQIGMAKAVTTAPVDNGNGTASVTYTLLVSNSGNVALGTLQVVDSLATTFAGAAFVVDSVTSADFTVNNAYDGDADSNLLTGGDALAIATSGTIVVEVTVTPAGNSGPFNNTATASGLSPANTAVTDDSTDGSDADPDADGNPGNNSDPTPVTLPVLVASLEGSAWFDANIDDVFDSVEAPLSGWVIEILQNGVVVQTTNVNPDGSYAFTGLTPGDYDLRLRNPANLATFGTLLAVNLPPGTTVLDQNLPIDPSGVVYDSDTRAPIAGATVTLVDGAGNALPDACLLPDQQNQVTDALGVYRFDVVLGAAAACQSGGTYTLVVVEPTGYLNPPSLVIAPQAGPLVATGGPNPFTVAPQSGPPQAGDSTVYYFSFILSTGDPDVIHNHIPLDPPAGIADIRLSKTAAKKQVLIGELVPYTLTAENIGVVALSNVTLSDQLPAGFSYVDSSARLVGAGTLSISGQRPVLFDGIDIPVGGSATVTYVLRVGAGVTQGDYVNTATPMLGGVVIGNAATATVTVISDPDFEQTTIIGSVFGDANGNGWQDPGEIGLPGIRLGTVEGLLVETDAFGRYHLAGIEGGRLDRGRNFIIKVDPSTLPDGALFTTENPRVQRITQGLMNSINFGVQMPAAAAACCERIAVKLGEVFFADNSAEVSPEFVPMLDQLADRLIEHGGGRLTIAGNDSCTAPVKSAAPVATTPQVQSYTLTPRFGVRKAELQPADKEELNRIAADWAGASGIEILAVGHTSNVRIAPANRKEFKSNYELSEARAQSVATYLGQVMGLSSQQIAQIGRGPDQPVASNATASGRAKNRRVELQIKGVRGTSGRRAASSGPTCSHDLAKRRADNVMKALGRRLGKDMIKNIDVVIGDTIYKPLESESVAPKNTAPAETVSENYMNKKNTVTSRVRQGLTALMSVLVTTAHAAEMPACSIDSCMTDEGYAIQITGYTDDQPMSADDSPAALADSNRVDISGEFLVRVPGGGMMWATEDPAVKDPRMAAHAHETLPVTAGRITQPIDFYVYKNYDAFIDRAELLIFHGDDIDRIAPLATLPIGKGDLVRVQWDGRSNRMINAGDQVYYIVQAFDRGGRKDTTAEMGIAAISAIDYDGPDSYAIPRVQSNGNNNSPTQSSSLPMDGKLLVLQPGVAATETTKVESDSYRLTPRFDTRKTELKPHDRAELDRIALAWKGAGNIRIFAEGHTDNIRIAPMNRKEFANNKVLSDARAQAVGQYLASRLGLSSESVHAVGYGQNRPVANNSTADGRAQNRRVELTISGDRITGHVAAAGRDSSMYLLDPASRSSVPVISSINEALNILNTKVGVRSYTPDAQATGRSAVVDCSTAQVAAHQVQAVYGRNQLSKQNIPMYGSRVRLHGQDVNSNYALAVNGNVVPVDTDGKFAVDYMMPVGQHDMNVEFMDQSCTVRNEGQLNVDVSGRHMFMVGLADFTLSDKSISGSIEPLSVDDRYDDDFLIEGRLAFYLKGKIRGKYLITAQLDTQEEELSNLLDNLDEKDPRSIFRRLDPDRYYPVYGDDSTTIADTDSIGKMYLRADWDKSRAVWGNFHTGVTGTEFAQYNRSLYGGQFDWHSLNANAYGDSSTDLNLFVSENQAELGHSEFRGTGGSLYYLKHTDLLPGSEKLHIEIRDRDSARVLENITLVRGVDYEIDELQGRVMLTRPLMQITQLRGPTLIKDAALDGNDAILLADYEYIPGSFDADHVIMGARGRHWFGDHFALGATYVEEGRGAGASDYTLMGAEMILQATPHTYIKAEVAETEDSQVARFFSNNGGLNFDQVGPVGNIPNREGAALGVEARINTKEWLNTQNEWVMAAWYRNTEEGFSVARRDDGYEVTESGLELTGHLGERWQITGRASSVERKTLGDESSIGLQVDYRLSAHSTLAAEVRQVQEQRTAQNINADGLIGALRYTRVLNERWEAYAQGQYTIDNDDGRYDNNDMGTIGLIARLNDKASLIGEYSSGHRGDGASLSLDYEINSRHRVYGTYTHSADRTDDLANDQISIGQRSALSDQLSVFNEHQFSEYRDYAGISHVFGLDYAPRPGWSLGASYQTGDLETDTGLIERDSISGTLAYQGDRLKWSTKLELRDDTGNVSDQEQWVTSNRVDYKLSDNTRLLGRFNHSETDDNINANFNAQFTEAQIGMAYRPVYNNRFNALLKYTYLYDLRGFDQIQTGPDQRSNVLSMEGIYKLNPRWDVGGKYAYRTGELRTDRDNGDWFESTTSFYALRGRYHLVRAWDAMAEYRWLDVEEAGSTRTGWLVALDRHFGNNLKLGLGYNFTDYSDDLTNLDYDRKGWFLNAVGKY